MKDSERYLDQARQARERAETVRDLAAKTTSSWLEIAKNYDDLARLAERNERK